MAQPTTASPERATGPLTYDNVTRAIARTLGNPGQGYYVLLGSAVTLLGIGIVCLLFLLRYGMGMAGYSMPTYWAIYITCFVFWVGIAHSGTLISAILFLFRSGWRTAVYRVAEVMTVFAVMTAGLFPLIHIGRQWFFYWLLPYPNERGRHYRPAYLYLAALATPLVLSVHSVVSWDFAMAQVPAWHETLFAPYFVAGAIYSGCAMVITLLVPMRKLFQLEQIVTVDHFENLAKLCLLTGMIVCYAYVIENYVAWYGGPTPERDAFWYRAFGRFWWAGWTMNICNAFLPWLLWFKKIRTNITALFVIAFFVNLGMWMERFVIISVHLAGEPFEPFVQAGYNATWADWGIMAGSFGWFFMWFLLFVKNFPAVSVAEVKEELPPPRRAAARHA